MIEVSSHTSVNRLEQGQPADRTNFRYVIAGAGCAGLSFAWNLLDLGVDEPILLVDGRSSYWNDRTWCFWNVLPTPFQPLATHAWPAWEIIDQTGLAIRNKSSRYSYLRLPSINFYKAVLQRLRQAPNVTVSLGNPLAGLKRDDDQFSIHSARGTFRGSSLIDSIGLSDRYGFEPKAVPGRLRLLQHFVGLTIEARTPVFNTGSVTLMDFRTHQEDGVHFIYLLPLSPTRALVENTYFFPCQVTRGRHEAEIRSYLQSHRGLGPEDYTIESRESGAIPMRPPIRRRSVGGIHRIGLAGGAARPSSGYAFLRIQRQTRMLAEALVSERTPSHWTPEKYDFLDTVFLEALAGNPKGSDRLFLDLFANADADSVVRFLSDVSTLGDDLKVISSLPLPWFLRSAIRSAPVWGNAMFRTCG